MGIVCLCLSSKHKLFICSVRGGDDVVGCSERQERDPSSAEFGGSQLQLLAFIKYHDV